MKLVRVFFPSLLAVVLLLGACTALEPAPPVIEKPPAKSPILTATGEWKPGAKRDNELSAAQQKLLATQAAKRDAQRNLAIQMDNFRLAEGATIGALASKNDAARSYVDGLVRSAPVIETKTLTNRNTQVRVAVELSPALQACLLEGKCPPPPGCAGPLRKVLVTAFPLRYPEQIHHGEYMGWPQATAEELARLFNRGGKLLSTGAPQRFPFDSAESAPELERKQGVPLLSGWASQAQAQYVVAGMFQDFGKTWDRLITNRQLLLEAYIYDGNSGALLARREFSRQIAFGGSMPRTVTPGTRAFNSSSIGGMYNEVLGEIGHWAESTVSCLPFSARVIRAEGRRLHLDVGSDSGVVPGMEFILTRTAAEPVSTAGGEVLTAGRIPVAGVVVVQDVHPRYSVAEVGAQQNPPQAQPSDVLYGL